MGRIAKLLSFVRVTRNDANMSDVKVNPGGEPNITGEHFADAGDDAFPLTTDYVLIMDRNGTGREAIIGYIDPVNTPKAVVGDKRIYGRGGNGVAINEVWLQNDGSVLVSNANGSVLLRPDGGSIITTPASTFDAAADGSITGANGGGSFELQVGGDFVVNGVIISSIGVVTIPTSLILNSKEMAEHNHSQGADSDGDTQVNTGVNN